MVHQVVLSPAWGHKDSGVTTREQDMTRHFTLEYWVDEYVGKLNEVPGVFGQGER